jgi:sugar phosphate isomerase/epimerase
MKKLSIGSWAFLFNQEQPTTDFHTLVHKLGHLGYQGIELGAFAPHPNPDSHDTKEKRQKLRKMVVDHRLEFSALVPELWSQKLWSVEDHGPFLAAFEKNVLFAEDLGIKTIRVDTVEPSARVQETGIEPPLLFDRCVKAFDACSKLAAPHGVTIAWAFEPAFPINQPAQIVALIDAVRGLGNTNFGALYDTCDAHMCSSGAALDLLQRLKGKIAHLHLADSDGTLNAHGRSVRVPFGQGVLNFDQLMPELLTCGVPNDWWCVDIGFVPDAWAVTADSKRFLDRLRHKYLA